MTNDLKWKENVEQLQNQMEWKRREKKYANYNGISSFWLLSNNLNIYNCSKRLANVWALFQHN